jgi:hypothetical protein
VNITNKWKTIRTVLGCDMTIYVERTDHGPVDYIPKCLYQARLSGKNGLRGRYVNVLGSGTAREISYTFTIDEKTLHEWREVREFIIKRHGRNGANQPMTQTHVLGIVWAKTADEAKTVASEKWTCYANQYFEAIDYGVRNRKEDREAAREADAFDSAAATGGDQ